MTIFPFILSVLAQSNTTVPFTVITHRPDGTSVSVTVNIEGYTPVPSEPEPTPHQKMLLDWRVMHAEMVDAKFSEEGDAVTFGGRWLIDVHAWMILKTRIAFRGKQIEAEGGR